jgi:hypothetical protein
MIIRRKPLFDLPGTWVAMYLTALYVGNALLLVKLLRPDFDLPISLDGWQVTSMVVGLICFVLMLKASDRAKIWGWFIGPFMIVVVPVVNGLAFKNPDISYGILSTWLSLILAVIVAVFSLGYWYSSSNSEASAT